MVRQVAFGGIPTDSYFPNAMDFSLRALIIASGIWGLRRSGTEKAVKATS
jgi:hypothetical protein